MEKQIVGDYKTFKIGEYAIGGIIDVSISPSKVVTITCIDWDTKEKVCSQSFDTNEIDSDFAISECLNEYTSHYYAEQIFDYIKQYVNFKYNW